MRSSDSRDARTHPAVPVAPVSMRLYPEVLSGRHTSPDDHVVVFPNFIDGRVQVAVLPGGHGRGVLRGVGYGL